MKIRRMHRMLGALLQVVAVTVFITVPPLVLAQGSQHKYADDAIVRDLKAGKLSVRQAQTLREQRERTAVTPRRKPKHKFHSHASGGKALKSATSREHRAAAPMRSSRVPHGKKEVVQVNTSHRLGGKSVRHNAKPHEKLLKTGKVRKGKAPQGRNSRAKHVRKF